jgi:hypothetical protein
VLQGVRLCRGCSSRPRSTSRAFVKVEDSTRRPTGRFPSSAYSTASTRRLIADLPPATPRNHWNRELVSQAFADYVGTFGSLRDQRGKRQNQPRNDPMNQLTRAQVVHSLLA